QVLAELFFIPSADDHVSHTWPLEQPIERNLRNGLPGLLRHLIKSIYDLEEVFLGDRRADVRHGLALQAARFGERLAAANLACQPAPAERAQATRPDPLLESQRHEFPLEVAPDERVIRLMGDIACQAVLLRHGERFHQVPAREVRTADVADLAGTDEVVESAE